MGLEVKSVPALLTLVRGNAVDRADFAGNIPSGPSGWSSWNLPLISLMCEALVSLVSGNKGRLDWCLGVIREYLKIHPFMAGEQHSVIYWSWAAFPIWVCGAMAAKIGDTELAMACRNWLRALVAYLAFGAVRGPGNTLLDHNLDHADKPRVLKATGPRVGSAPFVVWAGKRGWSRVDTDGDKVRDQFAHLDSPARGLALSQAARLGLAAGKNTAIWEREMAAAILKRFGGSPWMLTDIEAQDLQAYLANPADPRRAIVLLQWLRGYVPQYKVIWRRYERGVACLLTEWGESSTAELGFCAAHDDGECLFASAATGGRQTQGSGDTVDPGHGEWVLDHLAEIQRDDGLYKIACEIPEKYGKRLYDLEVGHGIQPRLVLPNGQVLQDLVDVNEVTIPAVPPVIVPPPGTPAKPAKKKESWLEKMGL